MPGAMCQYRHHKSPGFHHLQEYLFSHAMSFYEIIKVVKIIFSTTKVDTFGLTTRLLGKLSGKKPYEKSITHLFALV